MWPIVCRGMDSRVRRPLNNRHSREGGNPGLIGGSPLEMLAISATLSPTGEVTQRSPSAGMPAEKRPTGVSTKRRRRRSGIEAPNSPSNHCGEAGGDGPSPTQPFTPSSADASAARIEGRAQSHPLYLIPHPRTTPSWSRGPFDTPCPKRRGTQGKRGVCSPKGSGDQGERGVCSSKGSGTRANGVCVRPKAAGTRANGLCVRPKAAGTRANGLCVRPKAAGTRANRLCARPKAAGTRANRLCARPKAAGAKANGLCARPKAAGAKANRLCARPKAAGTRANGLCARPKAAGAEANGLCAHSGGLRGAALPGMDSRVRRPLNNRHSRAGRPLHNRPSR